MRVFDGQNWKANRIAKWCRQGYWEHFSWGVIIRASHPPLRPTPLRSFWFFERFSRRILWHLYLTEYSPWQQKHEPNYFDFWGRNVGFDACVPIQSVNNSLLFTVGSARARNDGMGAVKMLTWTLMLKTKADPPSCWTAGAAFILRLWPPQIRGLRTNNNNTSAIKVQPLPGPRQTPDYMALSEFSRGRSPSERYWFIAGFMPWLVACEEQRWWNRPFCSSLVYSMIFELSLPPS